MRSRGKQGRRRPPDFEARRAAAQQGDVEIQAILRRSSELTVILRDWLHYDKAMKGLVDQSNAAVASMALALAREREERLKVLEEQMSLHFDIQILEDEDARRAGRPTLAEKAAEAFADLRGTEMDAASIVTMLDTLPRVPGRPPTENAINQYKATVAAVLDNSKGIFVLMADCMEVTRIREAKGQVPLGSGAAAAEPRVAANKDLIEKDMGRLRDLAATLEVERQSLLERRASLMRTLGMSDAD